MSIKFAAQIISVPNYLKYLRCCLNGSHSVSNKVLHSSISIRKNAPFWDSQSQGSEEILLISLWFQNSWKRLWQISLKSFTERDGKSKESIYKRGTVVQTLPCHRTGHRKLRGCGNLPAYMTPLVKHFVVNGWQSSAVLYALNGFTSIDRANWNMLYRWWLQLNKLLIETEQLNGGSLGWSCLQREERDPFLESRVLKSYP